MSWTKRQFVTQAFEEIGYASYVYDLEPEQLQSAMSRLDGMMATWNGRGIKLNYPLPSSPESSDLDQETGVPDYANEAIYLNLSIRLAPTVGKSVSMETKASARRAYTQLLSKSAMPPEMRLPRSMPRGAGSKPHRHDQQFILDSGNGNISAPENEVNFNE